MRDCPFCLGKIPLAAVKCQHCGEWVDGRPPVDAANNLWRAARYYISLRYCWVWSD